MCVPHQLAGDVPALLTLGSSLLPPWPSLPAHLGLSRYRRGQLVEVNAHSLFSKWFSESGKLVSKLFGAILEFVEEEDTLVFVLIDEVESLTSARKVRVRHLHLVECLWYGAQMVHLGVFWCCTTPSAAAQHNKQLVATMDGSVPVAPTSCSARKHQSLYV
jgi:SpoVK/Ycf46/Vps4 family AAA+-type ATPase